MQPSDGSSPAQAVTRLLIDWKSGKPWEDPLELAIQALCLRAERPELIAISGFYIWLRVPKVGQFHADIVNDTGRTLAYLWQVRKSMESRLAKNDWPADEGPLCAWCPVGKEQCSFKKDRPQ